MMNKMDTKLIGLLGGTAFDAAKQVGKGLGNALNDLIDKLLPLDDDKDA
jgi:hypothetical protein